jgi:hypothetical protein
MVHKKDGKMAKNACQHFCKKKKATQKGKTQQGH